MEIIVHRINTCEGLAATPTTFGTEIDIRACGSRLILNHEPMQDGENLEDYLDAYDHGTLVLNIKEAGIEDAVLDMVHARGIRSYFLLDVEMPYVYRASVGSMSNLAIRYSEYEPIALAEYFAGKFDWVWIDTVTQLPLDNAVIASLNGYKTCLVCPERWGRPEDIAAYKAQLVQFNYQPNAVMTARKYAEQWQRTSAN